MDVAYLDWNASAPLHPAARVAMTAALEATGNPSSVHRFGREARRVVERARDGVCAFLGNDAAEVVFTSGATEANRLALAEAGVPVIVSAVEHVSVLAAAGANAVRCPVDRDGRVDLDRLGALLAAVGEPALVSVMAANNETGVVQPVAEVVAIARRHDARVHCDAAQVAGRMPFDMAELGVDLVSLSAHKLGGPQGVGALAIAPGAMPVIATGDGRQERGRRPGTENVAGIAGFGAACLAARDGIADRGAVAALRDRLERRAIEAVPRCSVVAGGVERLPNTSALTLPGADSATLVMALDLAGIAVSAGAACSSGKVQASHVLAAMGRPDDIRRGTIRVSLGPTTMAAEIDLFVEAWSRIAARLDANHRAAA